MYSVTQTIRDYELVTAGRFYSWEQRKALFDLVARANLLSGQVHANLASVVFSSEVEEYKNETDCANGMLLMSVLRDDNHVKAILTCRKKTLANLVERRAWDSKDTWIKFMRTQGGFFAQFDSAIYAYSVDDIGKSITLLKPLAERCHYLSVKLLIALCRELPSNQDEAKYILLLKRIREELYDEVLPTEYETRLKDLLRYLPQNVVESVNNVKLQYFDEYAVSRIGF